MGPFQYKATMARQRPFLFLILQNTLLLSSFKYHKNCFLNHLLPSHPFPCTSTCLLLVLYSMASNSLFKTFRHNRKIMGKSGRALRCFFAVAVLVGVVWLLFVSIVANRATVTTKSTTVSSTGDLKHWEFVVDDFHFNYVSKRRVPNGPDPIHNRRVSKSRQPPGRA